MINLKSFDQYAFGTKNVLVMDDRTSLGQGFFKLNKTNIFEVTNSMQLTSDRGYLVMSEDENF